MFVRFLLKKKNMLLFEIVRNFDYLKVGKYDFSIKEFCYLLLETFFESMRGKNCFIFFLSMSILLLCRLIRAARKRQVPISFA